MGRSKSVQHLGPVTFLFRIDNFAPDYSFHVAHSRFEAGPYGEYAHTQMTATCLAPARLAERVTEFTLIGDRGITAHLIAPPTEFRPLNGVGTLTMRGSQSRYLGSLPFDALMAIAPCVLTGGIRFVTLVGPPLLRGSTRISGMTFVRDADPNDY